MSAMTWGRCSLVEAHIKQLGSAELRHQPEHPALTWSMVRLGRMGGDGGVRPGQLIPQSPKMSPCLLCWCHGQGVFTPSVLPVRTFPWHCHNSPGKHAADQSQRTQLREEGWMAGRQLTHPAPGACRQPSLEKKCMFWGLNAYWGFSKKGRRGEQDLCAAIFNWKVTAELSTALILRDTVWSSGQRRPRISPQGLPGKLQRGSHRHLHLSMGQPVPLLCCWPCTLLLHGVAMSTGVLLLRLPLGQGHNLLHLAGK